MPWLVQRSPLLLTILVGVIIIVVRFGTWPETPQIGDAAIADGFLIAVEEEGALVSYGFDLPDGSRVFDKLRVGTGDRDANVEYGWDRQGAGSLILVAYDASDPSVSLPFLEFPYWGTGAWAVLIGSIVWPLAVVARRRLVPATAPMDEPPGDD